MTGHVYTSDVLEAREESVCPKCKLHRYLSSQRLVIDRFRCIQVVKCNYCNNQWNEVWTSIEWYMFE